MANVDKLARAFDALKTHQQGGTSDESGQRWGVNNFDSKPFYY